jgi:probable HAF family extracellular repeat protein
LGTLGGTLGEANGISNKGWVAGFANLPGDQSFHATLWTKDKGLQDLGTLGGLNSDVSFPVKDDRGLIAGGSDISAIDPFAEDFCSYGSGLICQGFLWHHGVMTPLPTLGGNNGAATGVNNRGQVVGYAETATQDPNCIAPQVFDWEAFIWDLNDGKIHELPPLPGDSLSAATGINEHGQVVGASGPICAQPQVSLSISTRVVLWQNGSVIDLGSLGGVANNLPFAINNRGQVVGQSDLPGDATFHAFLWTIERGMQDLGTLPGDVTSGALGMNNKGQVVGGSNDANGNGRAFLWQDGVMTDLNALIPPDSSLYLVYAGDINDDGEIVGLAFDQSAGTFPAFLARPCERDDVNTEDCRNDDADTLGTRSGTNESPKVTLPESIRKLLQRRRGLARFGLGG